MIATVFSGVVNRMTSGYLLRDVINKVNSIHFLAKEELFTLGHLYESMLKEMRDAAGENGEFYTPRPVVQFMVKTLDPRLGETVLDPACGTGGFLVEAYHHLERQCKTVADRKRLQSGSLFGGEAKPLPYLLSQMNLLLHGLEVPQVDPENSLRFKLTEIGDKERVDVILTNPPFGGEEEPGIKGNFPADMQTSETALLFLQLIMRKLRRPGPQSPRGGRAAVVVPNGVLSGDGVCARVKEQLLKEFNLHTIVRLPNGVFSPYTSIPTNLLFFDRSGSTSDIWYYELPLPEGRKNYTKTMPLSVEEFAGCISWWTKREESAQAWRVRVADVSKHGEGGRAVSLNLDIKNPHAVEGLEHLPPDNIADDILAKERHFIETVEAFKGVLLSTPGTLNWQKVSLGTVLTPVSREVVVEPLKDYPLLGIRLEGGGPFLRETRKGSELSARTLFRVNSADFIYSRLFAWRGAFGVVPEALNDSFVSSEFPTFVPKDGRIDVRFLDYWFRLPQVLRAVEADCTGSTPLTRNRYKEPFFLRLEIPLPSIAEQRQIVAMLAQVERLKALQAQATAQLDALLPSILDRAFKGEL